MQSNPKVSVIMPVYNSESYMKKSIDSVLNQSLREIELICINDKSTDGSLVMLKEIQKRDSRLKIIDNRKNVGPGEGRNRAMKKSMGNFILFVDSDDWLELDACEKLYKIAKSKKAEVVYIRPKIIYGKKVILDKRLFKGNEVENKDEVFRKNLRREIAWAPWSKMIRRDLIIENKIAFPPIHIAEDMVFSVKVLALAKKISECKDYLYNYLIREGSLMSYKNSQRRIENYFESIKLVRDFMVKNKIFEKYEKDFLHFKFYNYLAIYGVMYSSSEKIERLIYKDLIKKDRDFRLYKILKNGSVDSVTVGSLLIKMNLFGPMFFLRQSLRKILGKTR